MNSITWIIFLSLIIINLKLSRVKTVLFHITHIDRLPSQLKQILNSSTILKLGVEVTEDIKRLEHENQVRAGNTSGVELRPLLGQDSKFLTF